MILKELMWKRYFNFEIILLKRPLRYYVFVNCKPLCLLKNMIFIFEKFYNFVCGLLGSELFQPEEFLG